MSGPRCFACHRNLDEVPGRALHRANPKGAPAVWVCNEDIHLTDAQVDPEVAEICDVIGSQRGV